MTQEHLYPDLGLGEFEDFVYASRLTPLPLRTIIVSPPGASDRFYDMWKKAHEPSPWVVYELPKDQPTD